MGSRSKSLKWSGALSIVLGIVTFPLFALNIMAFDAPGSLENDWMVVRVFGLIAVPVLAVLGGAVALISKRWFFLLAPLAGLLVSMIGQAFGG